MNMDTIIFLSLMLALLLCLAFPTIVDKAKNAREDTARAKARAAEPVRLGYRVEEHAITYHSGNTYTRYYIVSEYGRRAPHAYDSMEEAIRVCDHMNASRVKTHTSKTVYPKT